AEGQQGVDTGGAASGKVRGQERHSDERRGNRGQRSWIAGFNSIQKAREAGQDTSQHDRGDHAYRKPKQTEAKSLTNYQPQNRLAFRSKGDADADFADALADRVGYEAVYPNGCEQQSQHRKSAQQHGRETLSKHRLVEDLADGLNVVNGLIAAG